MRPSLGIFFCCSQGVARARIAYEKNIVGGHKTTKWLVASLLIAFLGGCQSSLIVAEPRRPSLLAPHPSEAKPLIETPLSPQPLVDVPRKASVDIKNEQTFQQHVSVSLVGTSCLPGVLESLARGAGANFSVSCGVFPEKDVRYTVHNKPLYSVIKDLCVLNNLCYKFYNDTLMISKDVPYLHVYSVPFLLGERTSNSNLVVNYDGLRGSSQSNQLSSQPTSSTLSYAMTNDFWKELQGNLRIFFDHSSSGSFGNFKDPSKAGDNTKNPGEVSHKKPFYSLHPQAGLVSVHATRAQHQQLEAYFQKISRSVSSSVVIEAKILEVSLKKEWCQGIDWGLLRPGSPNTDPTMQLEGVSGKTMFSFQKILPAAMRLESLFHFVESFGKVRTLSNPRMTILNNQPAILKAAKNEVFFTFSFHRDNGSVETLTKKNTPSKDTVVSVPNFLPVGLVMVVHPCIDFKTKEIILSIRPTISSVVDVREDPAVSLRSQGKITSSLPVVQVREIDSLLRIQSGDTVVMGGLIQSESRRMSKGPSLLGGARSLLGKKEGSNTTTELIIFLKASLAP